MDRLRMEKPGGEDVTIRSTFDQHAFGVESGHDKPMGPAGLNDEDDDDPTILVPRDTMHWSLNDGWFHQYLYQGVSSPWLSSKTGDDWHPKQSGSDAEVAERARRTRKLLLERAARKHSGKDAITLKC